MCTAAQEGEVASRSCQWPAWSFRALQTSPSWLCLHILVSSPCPPHGKVRCHRRAWHRRIPRRVSRFCLLSVTCPSVATNGTFSLYPETRWAARSPPCQPRDRAQTGGPVVPAQSSYSYNVRGSEFPDNGQQCRDGSWGAPFGPLVPGQPRWGSGKAFVLGIQ